MNFGETGHMSAFLVQILKHDPADIPSCSEIFRTISQSMLMHRGIECVHLSSYSDAHKQPE